MLPITIASEISGYLQDGEDKILCLEFLHGSVGSSITEITIDKLHYVNVFSRFMMQDIRHRFSNTNLHQLELVIWRCLKVGNTRLLNLLREEMSVLLRVTNSVINKWLPAYPPKSQKFLLSNKNFMKDVPESTYKTVTQDLISYAVFKDDVKKVDYLVETLVPKEKKTYYMMFIVKDAMKHNSNEVYNRYVQYFTESDNIIKCLVKHVMINLGCYPHNMLLKFIELFESYIESDVKNLMFVNSYKGSDKFNNKNEIYMIEKYGASFNSLFPIDGKFIKMLRNSPPNVKIAYLNLFSEDVGSSFISRSIPESRDINYNLTYIWETLFDFPTQMVDLLRPILPKFNNSTLLLLSTTTIKYAIAELLRDKTYTKVQIEQRNFTGDKMVCFIELYGVTFYEIANLDDIMGKQPMGCLLKYLDRKDRTKFSDSILNNHPSFPICEDDEENNSSRFPHGDLRNILNSLESLSDQMTQNTLNSFHLTGNNNEDDEEDESPERILNFPIGSRTIGNPTNLADTYGSIPLRSVIMDMSEVD